MLAILGVFLAISAFVLLRCPPLWRDYDGLIQITSRPNDMVILQYPAAYPFFSRMHIYAAEIVKGWCKHQKAAIHTKRVVVLNDAGIYALMISQQIILALALTALVWQGARTPGARWWIVALLASNASLFIMANLISTEALGVGVIVALVAISVRLFRGPELPATAIVAYGVCLFLAIMTRHLNAIFAMLLPVACLLRVIVDWASTRRLPIQGCRRLGLFIAIGLLCIAADQGTTRLLCRIFDVPYRDISARATVERLGFVNLMSPEEKEAFLAKLQASTDDPVVKEAIPLLARPASWVQQREEILKILQRNSPATDLEALKVKADAYLDRVARLYFRTRNPYLVHETINSIWRCLALTTATDVSAFYVKDGAWSIDLYNSHPEYSKKTQALAVCRPEAQSRIVAFESSPWLRLWAWAPHGLLLLAATVLALAFLVARRGEPAIPLFVLAIVLTALTATCLTFIMTTYGARFTTVAEICGFLAMGLVVAHWLDSRKQNQAARTAG
jgi:hypothetical protein